MDKGNRIIMVAKVITQIRQHINLRNMITKVNLEEATNMEENLNNIHHTKRNSTILIKNKKKKIDHGKNQKNLQNNTLIIINLTHLKLHLDRKINKINTLDRIKTDMITQSQLA